MSWKHLATDQNSNHLHLESLKEFIRLPYLASVSISHARLWQLFLNSGTVLSDLSQPRYGGLAFWLLRYRESRQDFNDREGCKVVFVPTQRPYPSSLLM